MAKDLKARHKLDPALTHADTPGAVAFRLLMATFDKNTHRISSTDFDCAYLQSSDRPQADWILIQFWHPVMKKWVVVGLRGVIYGEQRSTSEWKTTLTEYLKSQGFIELVNAP